MCHVKNVEYGVNLSLPGSSYMGTVPDNLTVHLSE